MAHRRILVVDDEQELTRTLGDFLLARDYRVYQAFTAREALDQLAKTPVDLVLLDLQLPDAHGTEVLARLRGQHPTLPVIIVTAYAPEHREGLLALNPTCVLEKPLSVSALLEAIAEIEGHTDARAPSPPLMGTVRVLVVDPVDAMGLALQQALTARRRAGRTYVVEQVTSREQASGAPARPDFVLINVEALKDGPIVAMGYLSAMQAGSARRPRDVLCYGTATSEAAKQQLRQMGVTALDVEAAPTQRIEQLAETLERLADSR